MSILWPCKIEAVFGAMGSPSQQQDSPGGGTYGDANAGDGRPTLLRDAFASIDSGTHTINGVDDVTRLLEQLELTIPTREDLSA